MSVEVVAHMSLGQTSGHAFTLSGRAMLWCSNEQKLYDNFNYGEIVYLVTIETKVLP